MKMYCDADLNIGEERTNNFKSATKGNRRTNIEYQYRHTNGEYFYTVNKSLDLCRYDRDCWIRQNDFEKAENVSELYKEVYGA